MGFAYSIARSEDTPGKLYLREWQILCLMDDMSLAYQWYSIRAFYSLGELEWGLAPVSYQTEKATRDSLRSINSFGRLGSSSEPRWVAQSISWRYPLTNNQGVKMAKPSLQVASVLHPVLSLS